MYSKNILRLDFETIGSYSKTVIGVLLITLVIPVGLSIMGVWEYGNENGDFSDVSETPFILDKNPLETSSSEEPSSESTSSEGDILEESPPETAIYSFGDTISGTSDEPVLEKGCFGPFDTAPGEMEIVDEHTILPTGDIPLCVTQVYLDQYQVMVAVKGGYEPLGGAMVLFQPKDTECVDGIIEIKWTEVTLPIDMCPEYDSCCWSIWVATFVLCSDPICLESSQGPDLGAGSDFTVCPPDIDLLKQVTISIITCWTGCPDPGQRFIVILAHKTMSQKEFPSPDKFTSPS